MVAINMAALRSRLTEQLTQQRLIKEDEERRQREKDESERINPLSVLLSIGGAALTAGLAGPLLGSIFGGATATAPAVTSGLGIGAGGIGSLGLGAGASSALAGSALPTALSVGGGGAAGAGIGSLLAPKATAGLPSAFQGPGTIPQEIPFAREEALLGGIKGAFAGLTPGLKPERALFGGVGQGFEALETARGLRGEAKKIREEESRQAFEKQKRPLELKKIQSEIAKNLRIPAGKSTQPLALDRMISGLSSSGRAAYNDLLEGFLTVQDIMKIPSSKLNQKDKSNILKIYKTVIPSQSKSSNASEEDIAKLFGAKK